MPDLLYPSCVVNFKLRFDETFRVDEGIPEPWPQGGDPEAASIPTATPTRLTTGGVIGTGVANAKRSANNKPLISQTGNSNLSFVANRIPKSASVELPGYRQAGRFSLELDWRELPIDPRLIRSAGVEIYMGSVPAAQFGRGMTGLNSEGGRASVLSNLSSDLMVLAGNADSWYTSHTDQGAIVRIEGRDLRATFLDSPIDPDVFNKLKLDQPLDQVIAAIIKKHPAGQYMNVIAHVQDWPNQRIPSVLDKDGLTRVRRKASGQDTSADVAGDDVSYWDIITRYCFLVGAVPFFRGYNLIIRPARSVYDESKPRFDPADVVFRPNNRVDDNGNPFTERKMVFGRNIRELNFERKLSGTKVPVVEIVSFDTSSKERGLRKLLVEQWPPADEKLARIAGVSPSGEVSQTDKLRIPVEGVRNRNQMLGIARGVYEEIGRGELGGSCKTSSLASFKGSNDDPDLLRLRPGDQVEFSVDTRQLGSRAPNMSTLTDDSRRPFAEQVREVRRALSGKTDGGDENLARVIVASSRSAIVDLLQKFRVNNVVFSWSLSSGVQVSFDFQNYFTIRYGINEQLGKNVVPVTTTTAVSNKAKRPKERVKPQPVIKSLTPGEKTSLSKTENGFFENSASGQEFF